MIITNERLRTMSYATAISVLLALALSLMVLSATPVGAQDGVRIIRSGGDDELMPPPDASCDDLVFITEVSFDPAGNPIDIPRFGSGPDLVRVFDIPDFEPVGPGILLLDEVIVYDGHIGRAIWDAQLNEQVRFEFLLDGEVQATTPLTPDVPDGQRTGWHILDMGGYELPNGADTLRIVHWGESPEVNSLVVSALCGHLEPFSEVQETTTTTEAPTATTDAPTTTAAPTTAAPTTAAPTTAPILPEVEGQVEERPAPELAVTGVEHNMVVAAALVAIALGLYLQYRRPENDRPNA